MTSDLERLRREAIEGSDRVAREKAERERQRLERLPAEVAREIEQFWMPAISYAIRENHTLKIVNNEESQLAAGRLFGSRSVYPLLRGRCDEAYVRELQKQLGEPFRVSRGDYTDDYGNESSRTWVSW
ncbi:MAG: hypothetical protein PS018_21205 [bacterium]|nr:hypothetical protein [bacterium]